MNFNKTAIATSAATRALNILRAMDLVNLLPAGELEVLESKIKMLKVS